MHIVSAIRSEAFEETDTPAPEVLLIGRDRTTRAYLEAAIGGAGFFVTAIGPWEAKCLMNRGEHAYPVVVFGHTLYPEDICEIVSQLRRRNPDSKLLLVLGSSYEPSSIFMVDATLEGSHGPAALIREIHRLTKAAKVGEIDGMPSALHSLRGRGRDEGMEAEHSSGNYMALQSHRG